MPELPEVETIRLGLQKYLTGHKIEGVTVNFAKIISGDLKAITGSKIVDVKRFGKGLVIDLDNGYSIAIHIKMTGQLIYQGTETKKILPSEKIVGNLPSKHTHVIFELDKGAKVYYNDIRKFGWIKIIKTEDVKQLPFFKELGPEPFVVPLKRDSSGQAHFQSKKLTIEYFDKLVSLSGLPIKVLLMDQKKIGGVGNIYANEALFVSGIDPRRKASSLSGKEQEGLYKAIIEVLKKGLKEHGATELNFVDALGQEGGYQNYFLVYSREGEKCKNCGGIIKKIKLGGRGTYFCPLCQR